MMRHIAIFLVALLVSACSLTAASRPAATGTAAPSTFTPLPRPTTATTPEPGSQVPTRHVVSASLNLARHELQVQQDILYTNYSAIPMTELLLLVEANRRADSVVIESALTGSTPLVFTLEGRRLNLALPQALQPGDTLQFTLDFRLMVPAIEDEEDGYLGWLGHSPQQLNLGNWLPVVAPLRDGTWLVPDAAAVGEQSVQELADWELSLNVDDAPAGLVVVGPGAQEQVDAQRWHFSARAARDFTLSIGADYQITDATLADGTEIEVYSLEESPQALASAAFALDVARRSMQRFGELFGPLPLQRLVVVEGDFPDGMEFSTVVFVSQDWFESWTGDPASFLTIITAHEVAHQWWYASVANDQAQAPWLDEALATYSELLLLESDFPQLTDWWWDWRVDRFVPAGFVDSEVYEFAARRPYINAVYLQGARLLHAMRQDLGDEAFFAWLRRHAQEGAGKIVTAADLWSLLDEEQLDATRATRQRFLRRPGP